MERDYKRITTEQAKIAFKAFPFRVRKWMIPLATYYLYVANGIAWVQWKFRRPVWYSVCWLDCFLEFINCVFGYGLKYFEFPTYESNAVGTEHIYHIDHPEIYDELEEIYNGLQVTYKNTP